MDILNRLEKIQGEKMLQKRLNYYFQEAQKHIDKIQKANRVLDKVIPIDISTLETLSEQQQDKLDILAFRFSKLQDLIGDKIFRNILEYSGVNTQQPFIGLLSELEREGILDLNRWITLRNARNKIAHEYPDNEDNLTSSINFIYENSSYLVELIERLERYFDEVTSKRNRAD